MAIPLSYNLRNLMERKTTTIMTALGIGLTVAVMLGILGLLAGLEGSFQATGDPLHVMVLRKGATAELTSLVTKENLQLLRAKRGMAMYDGEPMVALELLTVISLGFKGSTSESDVANVNVRGVSPMSLRLRAENVKLSTGRWFTPGQREVTVGRGVANAYAGVEIGQQIQMGRGNYTVVGVFDAGQTAFNGEIWGDVNQMGTDAGRITTLSSALLQATDAAAAHYLMDSINNDQQVTLDAIPELEYYMRQTSSGQPLKYLGIFVAIVMAVGSSFAAMNTMYAAVSRRAREIGVLRVLGFSRASILFSFVIESLLLTLIGGALACLVVLPFNGLASRMGNMVTFSQSLFEFRVTPAMIAIGMAFACLMGLLGGFWPARSAARKDVLTALRDL